MNSKTMPILGVVMLVLLFGFAVSYLNKPVRADEELLVLVSEGYVTGVITNVRRDQVPGNPQDPPMSLVVLNGMAARRDHHFRRAFYREAGMWMELQSGLERFYGWAPASKGHLGPFRAMPAWPGDVRWIESALKPGSEWFSRYTQVAELGREVLREQNILWRERDQLELERPKLSADEYAHCRKALWERLSASDARTKTYYTQVESNRLGGFRAVLPDGVRPLDLHPLAGREIEDQERVVALHAADKAARPSPPLVGALLTSTREGRIITYDPVSIDYHPGMVVTITRMENKPCPQTQGEVKVLQRERDVRALQLVRKGSGRCYGTYRLRSFIGVPAPVLVALHGEDQEEANY